jgi:hypothetical protein
MIAFGIGQLCFWVSQLAGHGQEPHQLFVQAVEEQLLDDTLDAQLQARGKRFLDACESKSSPVRNGRFLISFLII